MTQGSGYRRTPCQWLHYADHEMDPLRRSHRGSITPVTNWILYADHGMDPIWRSVTKRQKLMPLWQRRPELWLHSYAPPVVKHSLPSIVDLRCMACASAVCSFNCINQCLPRIGIRDTTCIALFNTNLVRSKKIVV